MATDILSPQWFLGINFIIDFFSFFVLLFIGFFSYKGFKLTKQKNYLYFAAGYCAMALSIFAKIAVNFTLYFTQIKQNDPSHALNVLSTINPFTNLVFVGVFVHRFLLLLGLFILLMVLFKITDKKVISLIIMLLFLTMWFSSYSLLVFRIIAGFILFLIFKYYYDAFMKKKCPECVLLSASFLIILISQLIFIFALNHEGVYVVAESVQLTGFILLLFSFITTLKH